MIPQTQKLIQDLSLEIIRCRFSEIELLVEGEDVFTSLWLELSVQACVAENLLRLLERCTLLGESALISLSQMHAQALQAFTALPRMEKFDGGTDTLDSEGWGEARCVHLIRAVYEEASAQHGLYIPRMEEEMIVIFAAHMVCAATATLLLKLRLTEGGISPELIEEREIHARVRGARLFERSIIGSRPNRDAMH